MRMDNSSSKLPKGKFLFLLLHLVCVSIGGGSGGRVMILVNLLETLVAFVCLPL